MSRTVARLQRLESQVDPLFGKAQESLWWSHTYTPEEELQILEVLYQVGALEQKEGLSLPEWERRIYKLLVQMGSLSQAGRELAIGVIKWMASELSDEELEALARQILEPEELLALWQKLEEALSGQG